MALTTESKEARIAALTRLALATREKVEAATFVLYVDDTASVPTDVMVEACHRLEQRLAWFPKVAELIDECRIVATRKQEQREAVARGRQLMSPADPDRLAKFLADVKAEVKRKSFRGTAAGERDE